MFCKLKGIIYTILYIPTFILTVLKELNLHVIKVNLTEDRFSFTFLKTFVGDHFSPCLP